jgi:DNA modification methylase
MRLPQGIVTKSIETLIPYARNARTHSDEQVAQIMASMKEWGWTNPCLITPDGTIVAGHGRVLAAHRLGHKEIPCIVADGWSEAQMRAYVIADNKLALNAGWDDAALQIELSDLQMEDFNLDLLGFSGDELDALLDGEEEEAEGQTDDDEVPDEPIIPISQLGDVWILGKHRLMCGDSTDKECVDRLMDGKLASLVVTDPPYGVAYTGKTKDALTIESDDVNSETLKKFVTAWFDRVDSVLADGAYVLATVPAGPLHLIFAGDWLDRGWLRQIMVWNKDSMVLGYSEYHYKHEPILFGWKPGPRLSNKDRTKTTVWDFPRPKRSTEHPTMKPVEMWVYAIKQHSLSGHLLYEPFSGSGTTIIAAEKTNRRCNAMELAPNYVDVAVKRWQEWTGKKATRDSDGKKFDELNIDAA